MAILLDVQRMAMEIGFELRKDNSNFMLTTKVWKNVPNLITHNLEMIANYLRNNYEHYRRELEAMTRRETVKLMGL